MTAPMRDDGSPGLGSAWFMTIMLCAMLLLSFVDRYSLTLLVDPVRHDFHLTDGQMGLLLGASFAIFYSVLGVPLGFLVDRTNRRNLVVTGVLVWSMMTVVSALATNYSTLLIGRMGVGLGEAVLTPAAFSMIRDAFPPMRSGRAMAVYLFGANVGTGASLLVVGWLSTTLAGSRLVSDIGMGGYATWRLVLLAIGCAGVPLGLLALLIREPARTQPDPVGTRPREVVASIIEHRLTFALLGGAFLFWGLCIYTIGVWLPTALSRGWSIPAIEVGRTYGAIATLLAPLALLVFSILISRMADAGRSRDIAGLAGILALAGVAPTILAPLALSPSIAWVAAGTNIFLAMGLQLMASLVITQVVPARITGSLSAIYYLLLNLFGLGLGPSLVPLLAAHFAPGPNAIGSALSIIAGGSWLIFALLMLALWHRLSRDDGSDHERRRVPVGQAGVD